MSIPVDSQAPTAAAEQSASVWEDMIDIFYAPGSVFTRRRLGRYGLALLMLSIASFALYFAARPLMEAVMDAEMTRGMARTAAANPEMTEEQLAMGRAMGEKFGAFAAYLTPLFVALGAFLFGLIAWVVGKIVGAKQSFAAAMTVVTFSMFPRLLEGVLVAVMALVVDPGTITSKHSATLGLARFLDPDSTNNTVLSLAGIVNPFALWGAFLIALGMHITGLLTWQRAIIVAAVVTIVRALLGF